MAYRLYYLQERARQLARGKGHVMLRFTLRRTQNPRQEHAASPRPAESLSSCRDCGAKVHCAADVAPWSVRGSGLITGSALRRTCSSGERGGLGPGRRPA